MIDLGPWFIVLAYFVIVGSSNAVNLTDGLDGLAIMPTVLVAVRWQFCLCVRTCPDRQLSADSPDKGSESWLYSAGALAGAGLGFLWFNAYPAQVFMGDVGALALGAALGVVAVIVRQGVGAVDYGWCFCDGDSLCHFAGGFVQAHRQERFSYGSFAHHFELKGWPEPRVIVRFWIVTVILVLIGLASLKIR